MCLVCKIFAGSFKYLKDPALCLLHRFNTARINFTGYQRFKQSRQFISPLYLYTFSIGLFLRFKK